MKYLIFTKKIWDKKNKDIIKHKRFIRKSLNVTEIKKIKPKRLFFIHWSKIISKSIYSNYECIQFHCSNLPKYRGGSPVQNQILSGKNKTKLSGFKVNGDIDGGDICVSKNLSLKGNANDIYKRIESISLKEIHKLTFKTKINYKKQIGKPSFYKRRTPSLSKIPSYLNKLEKIYNHIRMLDADTYPRSFLELKNFKIDFFKTKKKKNKIYGNFEIKKKK